MTTRLPRPRRRQARLAVSMVLCCSTLVASAHAADDSSVEGASAEEPTVEVSIVDGSTLSGAITSLASGILAIDVDGETKSVPLDSVLEIRMPAATKPQEDRDVPTLRLHLASGGQLTCRQIVMQDRTVVAETVVAGELRLPLAAVAAIRFQSSDPAVDARWAELVQSAPDDDLLIVRNGDVLDRLDGTLSGLDADTLTFLVGDQRVPIDRTRPKLFGLVTARSSGDRKPPVGELRLRNGDRLPVESLALAGDVVQASVAGIPANIRWSVIETIDLGRGKVRFLSDMEPRTLEHIPYVGVTALDSVFDVLKDHSDAGPDAPIRIDRQSFSRGLVIHSRTKLVYRLGGEYQRFVAVAGIEQLVRPRGDLDLIISADGRELFRQNIKGTDEPISLDLDVSGANELTIFVDFAGNADISDHLALGDARIIK